MLQRMPDESWLRGFSARIDGVQLNTDQQGVMISVDL